MKPQDIRIGDYVLAEGRVVRVAAVHERKVGYHVRRDRLAWTRLDRVEPIRITGRALQDFGFRRGRLALYAFSDDVWELDCRRAGCPDLDDFQLSWREQEDGCREYRIEARGYADTVLLPDDSIADLQHFFFDCNYGHAMPLAYRPQEQENSSPAGEAAEPGAGTIQC